MSCNVDQIEFIPPFCPNERCHFHRSGGGRFYKKNGVIRTQKAPFINRRFKCLHCDCQFSENTFSLEFRKKKVGLNFDIFYNTLHGMSNNNVARKLGICEATVRRRCILLGRQSLFFEKEIWDKVQLKEPVAYDGFETFTFDQYSPCYINTAVGEKSHFLYTNTFSPLNRKGRMTSMQKIKNELLLKKHGKYPSDSIKVKSEYAFNLLVQKTKMQFTLYTDEHKSYPLALKSVDQAQYKHVTINSKERRDPSNKLFPINRLHLIYRQFLSSQKRETISFQKNEAALMDKMQMMKIMHNFMKTKFVNKNKIDLHAHEHSPAMYVGAASKVLSFDEVFSFRRLCSHYKLDEEEKNFIKRNYEFSRRKILPY